MDQDKYTPQETYCIEYVYKRPNISMRELASQLLINQRMLREVINSIRKKGWVTELFNGDRRVFISTPLWLVGDNKGYSLEKKDSPRLEQWAKRYGNQAQDMNTILEVFNRTDLFTNFN